jgi:hypothetical protein
MNKIPCIIQCCDSVFDGLEFDFLALPRPGDRLCLRRVIGMETVTKYFTVLRVEFYADNFSDAQPEVHLTVQQD